MAETQTPNYKWTKPDIGGDASTWGNVLNVTFDAIDGVVWNNQQGVNPIGSIQMFAGATPPVNWLFCNGAVYLDTDIPALAPILNKKFAGSDASHSALPNLNGRMPVGCDFSGWAMGALAGEYNHLTTLSEMPAHNHPASQDAHTHAGSQAAHTHPSSYQDAHAHAVGNTSAHSHTIVTGNHSHVIATGGHSHGSNLVKFVGSGQSLGIAGGVNVNYGNTDTAGNLGGNTDTAGNLGGYTDTQALSVGNTDSRQPALHIDTQTPAVYIDTRTPNVYTANTGGGAAHNNMPPYLVVGFIIRYQ